MNLACGWCHRDFRYTAIGRKGGPVRYCSDHCRREAMLWSKRAWWQRNGQEIREQQNGLVCENHACSTKFAPYTGCDDPDGRRYCSKRCLTQERLWLRGFATTDRATIKDVAARAGVHWTTVYKVFRGETTTTKTLTRVLDAMADLNYTRRSA